MAKNVIYRICDVWMFGLILLVVVHYYVCEQTKKVLIYMLFFWFLSVVAVVFPVFIPIYSVIRRSGFSSKTIPKI